MDLVRGILKADAFFFVAHRHTYEILRDAEMRGTTLDRNTIIPLFRDECLGGLERREFVRRILSVYVSPLQAKDYAKTIMEDWTRRKIRTCASSFLPEEEKAREMASLMQEIDTREANAVSISAVLDRATISIETLYKSGGGYIGLETGIADLDKRLCGLERGALYVMAGRPAMGKSALALTVALNVAMNARPVQFFSLEMSNEQIAHRINARIGGVRMDAQRTGRNIDFSALQRTREELNGIPLVVVEKAGVTADWIVSKAKEIGRGNPPSLIMIDHLGIVAARDVRVNRVLQIGEMTATFKALAKEMNCPVVLLHQLNRGVEGRDDKRPTLADLRDSGSVEQDADAVIMLYREEYYLRGKAEPTDAAEWTKWRDRIDAAKNKAELIVVKNRQGETGIINIRFDGARQVFENLASA
jgi:replicative DNA helicase